MEVAMEAQNASEKREYRVDFPRTPAFGLGRGTNSKKEVKKRVFWINSRTPGPCDGETYLFLRICGGKRDREYREYRFYYLIFNYIPLTPFKKELYIMSFLWLISAVFSFKLQR